MILPKSCKRNCLKYDVAQVDSEYHESFKLHSNPLTRRKSTKPEQTAIEMLSQPPESSGNTSEAPRKSIGV